MNSLFITLLCFPIYWPVTPYLSYQTPCRQAPCLAEALPLTCRHPSWALPRTPPAPTSWSSPPLPSSKWPAPITPTSTRTSTSSTPPLVSSAPSSILQSFPWPSCVFKLVCLSLFAGPWTVSLVVKENWAINEVSPLNCLPSAPSCLLF